MTVLSQTDFMGLPPVLFLEYHPIISVKAPIHPKDFGEPSMHPHQKYLRENGVHISEIKERLGFGFKCGGHPR